MKKSFLLVLSSVGIILGSGCASTDKGSVFANLAYKKEKEVAASAAAKTDSTPAPSASGSEKCLREQQLMSATLWFQTSGEYRAICLQTFRWAKQALEEKLAEEAKLSKVAKTRKPAVIVDVDETVLDNGPFQARGIADCKSFPAGWAEWAKEAQADAVPGSYDFLNFAAKNGVDVYYITNRSEEDKTSTIKNLKAVGFPNVSEETVMVRKDTSSKEARRLAVSETHRIWMLMGDNLVDFSDVFEKKNPTVRRVEVENAQSLWGTRFFILPNPMYGDWESALYGYKKDITPDEVLQKRRESLILGR